MSRSLFAELKHRNVFKAGAAYLALGWVVVQVTATVVPALNLPAMVVPIVTWIGVIGFPFVIMFSWIYELTPEGLKRESEVDRSASITHVTSRRMEYLIVGLLVLAIGLFAVDRFGAHRSGAATSSEATVPAIVTTGAITTSAAPAATPAASMSSDKSIAVLPLANEGGNADEQYFSDGLSEDLITALSQFAGLKVIGRNSSFQFRDSKEDSRSIGLKLGVAHLLEGSVRRAGDVVRISAELVSTADGSTQWSQRYDRQYKDLFKLQDDITGAVAAELKTKLLASGVVQSDRPPSGNLDAYNALLQGNFQATRDSEAGYRAAVQQYSEAVRLDARYASAFAALSIAQTALAANGYINDVSEMQKTFAKARSAATMALALEPDNASAHRALGMLHISADHDWTNAEAEYRRAVELAPGNAQAKFDYDWILAVLGRHEEAVAVARQGLAIDSLNPQGHASLAIELAVLHRLDEAWQASRKALELQPESDFAHFVVAFVAIARGDPQAALESTQNMPLNIERDTLVMLSQQAIGDHSIADPALREFIATYANIAAYNVAEAYALRREPDKAFEWLDRAWTNREASIQSLLYDTALQPYQSDARFAAYCRKVGLPPPRTDAATDAAKPAGHGSNP